MLKIAVYNDKEIAREKAIHPTKEGKFNSDELFEFYNRIEKTISYDNSKKVKYYVRYIEE